MSNSKGGHGRTATTKASRATDGLVKEVAAKIANTFQVKFNTKIYTGEPTAKGRKKKILPDGGAYYINGKLALVVEAKYQQKNGNAIERWYKNMYITRLINPDVSYVTLGAGYIKEDGSIYQTLSISHTGEEGAIGKFAKGKNSLYLKETWNEEEVTSLLSDILKQLING